MNTAVIIEPRKIDKTASVIHNFQSILSKNEWNFVFYCGKDLKQYWEDKVSDIEIRELDVDNLRPSQYNDLLKSRSFWEALTGEYILIFQLDTWLHPESNYHINDFIQREYSYLGGNMNWKWDEFVVLDKLNIQYNREMYGNFNGGLSLRKRMDMIRVIEEIPPLPTPDWWIIRKAFESPFPTMETIKIMAEDVYFTIGCHFLKLKVGDDEFSRNFARYCIHIEKPFGYHISVPYPTVDPGQKKYLEELKMDCPGINCSPFYDSN